MPRISITPQSSPGSRSYACSSVSSLRADDSIRSGKRPNEDILKSLGAQTAHVDADEAVKKIWEDYIRNRSANTAKAYTKRQTEYMNWCREKGFDGPDW